MDRFLVKGAVGGLKRRMEQEQTGGGPAGLAEEEGNSKKKPRRAAPGNGVDLAGLSWQHIRAEGLDCDYIVLFGKAEADEIFQELEKEVEYFTGKQGMGGLCVEGWFEHTTGLCLEKSELKSH